MAEKRVPYKVEWEIELDAYDELEAAELALQIQRDPESIATCFKVTKIGFGDETEVDLHDG